MSKLPVLSQNSGIFETGESLSKLPIFNFPIYGASQNDIEVAKTQSEAFHRFARMQENIAETKARTLLSIERMRLDTLETMFLISSTSDAMSQTLAMYHDDPMPSYMKCRAKAKLSGLFGKSCTITVEVQRSRERRNYYLRGPGK